MHQSFIMCQTTNHYVLLKNFHRLCTHVTKKHIKKYFCMNCIQNFPSQERVDKHKPNCMKMNKEQALEMPKEDTFISFNNIQNTLDVPFVIYADMKLLVVPLKVDENKNVDSQTSKTHEHIACSFAYKVVCNLNDKLSRPIKMFRSENSVDKFFEAIFEEEILIVKHLNKLKFSEPKLTSEEEKIYKNTNRIFM